MSSLSVLQETIAGAIVGLRATDVTLTSPSDTSVDVQILTEMLASSPTAGEVESVITTNEFIHSLNSAGAGVVVTHVRNVYRLRTLVGPKPPPPPAEAPGAPPPAPAWPSLLASPVALTIVMNAGIVVLVLIACCCILLHISRRRRPYRSRNRRASHFDDLDKHQRPRQARRQPSASHARPPEPEADAPAADVEAVATPPVEKESSTESPVPDDVLRVFQWYQTGPKPLAIELGNLRGAHLALGIDVTGAQLAKALSRYDVRHKGRLELAEFRTLIDQIRPLDEVLRIFKLVDRDASGDIDEAELHIGMHMLGLDGSTPQARELLRKFDKDQSGKIELDEFRRLIDKLKEFKESMFDEVARIFHRFDRNHSQTIDTAELKPALYALGLVADTLETLAILNKYDANRNGCLEFDEFKVLVNELRHFQQMSNDEVLRIFLAFDRDRSGAIDVRELSAALNELALNTDGQQASEILARFDRDNSGVLELGEFRRLVIDLRTYQDEVSQTLVVPRDDIHRIFLQYDADKSGDIDAAELFAALNDLGLAATSSEAAMTLDKYDVDRSLKLELDEFRALVTDLRAFQSKGEDETGRIFRRFDVDGSGAIEPVELGAALYALGLHVDTIDSGKIFKRYDHDNNGKLDSNEFRALVTDLRAFQFRRTEGGGYVDEDQVHRIFVQYDHDGSNSIDNAELRNALSALGLTTSGEKEVDQVMRRYDRDRSGVLEIGEFRELVFQLRRFQSEMSSEAAPPLPPPAPPPEPSLPELPAPPPEPSVPELPAPPPEPSVPELPAPPPEPSLPEPPLPAQPLEERLPPKADLESSVSKPPLEPAPKKPETVGDVFRRHDKDSSGDIDLSELKEALSDLGLTADTDEAAQVLAKFDEDKTGKLKMNEFRKLVKELKQSQKRTSPPPPYQAPPVQGPLSSRQVFDKFDKDGIHDIEVLELRPALAALGLFVDTAGAAQVLERFDQDTSGRLNFDEFDALVKEVRSFQSGEITHGD